MQLTARAAALAVYGALYVQLGVAFVLTARDAATYTVARSVLSWTPWDPMVLWGGVWITVGMLAIVRAPRSRVDRWTWPTVTGLSWLWAAMAGASWLTQIDTIPHGWTVLGLFGGFGTLGIILAGLPGDHLDPACPDDG